MPTDTETDAIEPAPEQPAAATETIVVAARSERLPFPPRVRRFRVKTPRLLRTVSRAIDQRRTHLVERLAATPTLRRRSALIAAILINLAMLSVLAVFGRVRIYVPNKPADSISIVYVDLSASPPTVDLRDPEIAPEPEPEPVEEPELKPEPETAPAPEPPAEPEPEPVIDLTPERALARPSEAEQAPFIPDIAPVPARPTTEEPLAGDINVEGEQAPAEDEQPMVSIEPEERQAEAEKDSGDEEEEDEEGAGEVAAGEGDERQQAPIAATEPAPPEKPSTGDDRFDEEPVFNGRRLALPPVDLPKGDSSAVPGTSGIVAIYCPEEFKDKEKIAECAGRPEIRSGWRPGSSGEDFSKAAAVLKDQRRHGDFSNDAVTFGPEIARQIEERRRIEDLEDFRKKPDLDKAGISNDPAAGTRPDLAPPSDDPSWARRDDPLVDTKAVEKLRKELEEAEKKNSPQ